MSDTRLQLFDRRLAGLSVNLPLLLDLRQTSDSAFLGGPLLVSLDFALICHTLVDPDSPESVMLKFVQNRYCSQQKQRTMFLMLKRINVSICVRRRYIHNKTLWLLSSALRLHFWLMSIFFFFAKCHFSSTADHISVTDFGYTANTHFPSKYVWEWGGSTPSLLSQCLANITNWHPAKMNNVQGKQRRRRRSSHISPQHWIWLKDVSITNDL